MYQIDQNARIEATVHCIEPSAAHIQVQVESHDNGGSTLDLNYQSLAIRNSYSDRLVVTHSSPGNVPLTPGIDIQTISTTTGFTNFIAACPDGTSTSAAVVEAHLRTAGLLPPVYTYA